MALGTTFTVTLATCTSLLPPGTLLRSAFVILTQMVTRRCHRHGAHYKHRYPKLSALCDTANHLILGVVIDSGPTVDIVEARQTLHEALARQPLASLLGDAGYESEGFHRLCWEHWGIRSIIPTTQRGRPPQGWSTAAGERPLSQIDEASVPRNTLWPALADRNGL